MSTAKKVILGICLWFAAALAVGSSGVIENLAPPFPQCILAVLTVIAITLSFKIPSLRHWLMTVDARWIVSLHLSRFIGLYFLYLYRHGELPYEFAVHGGVGDIIVATLAFLLVVAPPAPRRRYLLWNALGFIDIIYVVTTAARLSLANPSSMHALLTLPLNLLLTWLVPLIIASHVVLGMRLYRR